MEVKDAIFGFYLSPSSAVYIPKEGVETKKMKDGTIIKVPKHMYHPLTIEIMPRTDYKTIQYPKRKKFLFTMRDTKPVPADIRKYIENPEPEKLREALTIIQRRIRQIFETPVQTMTLVAFRFDGVPWKVHRMHWDEKQEVSYRKDGEWVTTTMKRLGNPWNLKSKVERDRKKAELFNIINNLLEDKDKIPYVSRMLMDRFR
jgi:hypothetical protein